MKTPPQAARPCRRGTLTAALLWAGVVACGDDVTEEPGGSVQETTHGLTSEQASKVLVRVGSREITVGEFAERLASESPYIRPRYNNPQNRAEYLHNMVDFELLALEARRRGLHELPAVQRLKEDRMIEALLEEEVYRHVRASDVSEDEIRQRYEANPAEYHQPEQRRAQHILVPDAQRARHVIQRLQQSGDAEETFKALCARFSLDLDTKPRFGDLRFFSAQPDPEHESSTIPQSLRDATFALDEVGDVFPEPVASDTGFHVVRLRAIRPALERSLDDARRIIQSQLLREKRQAAEEAFVAKLEQAADITMDLERLAAIDLTPPNGNGANGNGANSHGTDDEGREP